MAEPRIILRATNNGDPFGLLAHLPLQENPRKVYAVLFIPADDHAYLLTEGLGDAQPPMALEYIDGAQVYWVPGPYCRFADPCPGRRTGRRALGLAWEGKVLAMGIARLHESTARLPEPTGEDFAEIFAAVGLLLLVGPVALNSDRVQHLTKYGTFLLLDGSNWGI